MKSGRASTGLTRSHKLLSWSSGSHDLVRSRCACRFPSASTSPLLRNASRSSDPLLRRSCTLKIYTTPIVFRLLSQVKCSALQRFRLSQHWSYCASPEYDKKYYVDMRRMPQFAPNITSLSLCRVSVLTVRELEPMWPRLVELKVREFNPNQDWLQALYLCQNLQSCWLHRGYEPCALSQVTAESPVALPNLQRLFISIGLLRILSASIIFPELQELGIEITIVDKKLP